MTSRASRGMLTFSKAPLFASSASKVYSSMGNRCLLAPEEAALLLEPP